MNRNHPKRAWQLEDRMFSTFYDREEEAEDREFWQELKDDLTSWFIASCFATAAILGSLLLTWIACVGGGWPMPRDFLDGTSRWNSLGAGPVLGLFLSFIVPSDCARLSELSPYQRVMLAGWVLALCAVLIGGAGLGLMVFLGWSTLILAMRLTVRFARSELAESIVMVGFSLLSTILVEFMPPPRSTSPRLRT